MVATRSLPWIELTLCSTSVLSQKFANLFAHYF
jgi:hypothetical protein